MYPLSEMGGTRFVASAAKPGGTRFAASAAKMA